MVLSILFLSGIYKTVTGVRESLSILVFFYREKQNISFCLGYDTFLISLNLITLHFNFKRKFLNNLLNGVREEMLRKTGNKVSQGNMASRTCEERQTGLLFLEPTALLWYIETMKLSQLMKNIRTNQFSVKQSNNLNVHVHIQAPYIWHVGWPLLMSKQARWRPN